MIRVRRNKPKRPLETTISLINIVFLMLIFFLVTGQLTPPQDPDVILPETKSSDPLPPPDALYARGDGALVYREAPVTAADYLANHLPEREGAPRQVKLAADKNLGAGKLLQHVKALYGAGADAVVVVTRTTNK
ncbi:Biopolymer transport protein ExbD/TolR [Labrenzia sp. THAF82]|uniref:ExbD/TolR family protein n=1 Tax=Labrenzia sp. THAF82 TaxID=2587861 RepID=UPI001267847F|nr:biopolymer transporter ExbD [Labrenzia sp. THAF82]QFT30359.1 Biopolymer transport protein ExbD/TolR [Labrenzia sp. THAF82]